MRGRTLEMASQVEDASLDYLYIDGDHTLRGITIDLQLMPAKVKEGGFIAGDDFMHNIWQIGGKNYSPCEVFPYAMYYAEAAGLKFYTLPMNQFLMYNDGNGHSIVDKYNYTKLKPKQIYL